MTRTEGIGRSVETPHIKPLPSNDDESIAECATCNTNKKCSEHPEGHVLIRMDRDARYEPPSYPSLEEYMRKAGAPPQIVTVFSAPSTASTSLPAAAQESPTSSPAAPQKPGCLARLKEKIVEFLRRVISCLCCRSSKAEPVPVNPTTTEQPAPVIIPPSEPPLDQGGAVVPPRDPDKTIRKDESKKQLDEPEVESSEELIDFFEEQPVYRLAMQHKEDFSSLPHITDEEIIQFKKDFSPIIQILIVALQATPIGYQEGKIHIFYRQLDAAYRSADIPPQALSIDNIPKLQNHLLLQAKALFDKQFVEEFLARAKKEKREGKAQEPGEGTSIALASAPESDEEDSDIEEIE